jgi:hypothetical protein
VSGGGNPAIWPEDPTVGPTGDLFAPVLRHVRLRTAQMSVKIWLFAYSY